MSIELKDLMDQHYNPHWEVIGKGSAVTCKLAGFQSDLFEDEPTIIVTRASGVQLYISYRKIYREVGSRITTLFKNDSACYTAFMDRIKQYHGQPNSILIRDKMQADISQWWESNMPNSIRNLSADTMADAIWELGFMDF